MKQIIAVLSGVILASGVLARGQAPELQSIPFSAIQGVCVGNAQDDAAGTGVTVFRLTVPGRAAVAVFGGGPASRETEAIAPERNHPLNALVFSGGSAYGLAASGGVARCLEEHGVGFDTGIALVPIVCQSCIYDLGYGSATIRPDEQMGYTACEASFAVNDPRSGNVGAGTGATVGKAAGMQQAQKAGIGYAAAQIGSLQIGVAVVLNSFGDIYSHGKIIAGMLTPDRSVLQILTRPCSIRQETTSSQAPPTLHWWPYSPTATFRRPSSNTWRRWPRPDSPAASIRSLPPQTETPSMPSPLGTSISKWPQISMPWAHFPLL